MFHIELNEYYSLDPSPDSKFTFPHSKPSVLFFKINVHNFWGRFCPKSMSFCFVKGDLKWSCQNIVTKEPFEGHQKMIEVQLIPLPQSRIMSKLEELWALGVTSTCKRTGLMRKQLAISGGTGITNLDSSLKCAT